MQKLLTFFSKNISVYAIFHDQSFNDMLTNIVSFEQLDPVLLSSYLELNLMPFSRSQGELQFLNILQKFSLGGLLPKDKLIEIQ